MSKSLELSDATYDLIVAKAAKEGISPAELVERKFNLMERPPEKPAQPGRTLYDKLKPFIGCVEGTGENLARDHSRIFGEQLEDESRAGGQ